VVGLVVPNPTSAFSTPASAAEKALMEFSEPEETATSVTERATTKSTIVSTTDKERRTKTKA
jgi:hypothetical protein